MINKITTYSPVLSFTSLMAYSFYTIKFTNYLPCNCVTQYSNDFLMNEILFTLSGLFMLSVSFKLKLCHYNKLSAIGLTTVSLLNIIAILTPFNFSIYNSIITQISFILIFTATIYFLIKKI